MNPPTPPTLAQTQQGEGMGLFNRAIDRCFLCVLLVLTFSPAALAQDGAAGDTGRAPGAGEGMSIFEMFFGWSGDWFGRIVTWFLILGSIATIALVIHYIMQNRKVNYVPEDAVMDIEGLLSERKFRDAIAAAEEEPSMFGEVMHAALAEASNGYGAMERAVEETADLASSRKLRQIEILNVLGAVGPMLGLFGTVYGMILAFQKLVEAGGSASPEELAAGISTALVTTFWGLVVPIPPLAAYALIRNKIDALATEGMIQAEELISPFKPGGKRSAAGSGSAQRPRATPKPDASSES
jgi:biopolymer transport protein ExbB